MLCNVSKTTPLNHSPAIPEIPPAIGTTFNPPLLPCIIWKIDRYANNKCTYFTCSDLDADPLMTIIIK